MNATGVIMVNSSNSTENGNELELFSYLGKLGEKPKTTIRIFERNDIFTVYNEDAMFASKEFFKTTNVLKHEKKGSYEMTIVTFNKLNFENFVRELLLVRHYRVELYRWKGVKLNNWEFLGKASPGNVQQFEDLLYNKKDMAPSTILMSFKLCKGKNGEKVVAVCFIDISERKLSVCEFVDNDHYSNFEALVIQVGPKECLVKAQDNDKMFKTVMERSNVLITECKNGDFNAKDIIQDLQRLLKIPLENVPSLNELNLKGSMSCLSSIIKYLELLLDESMFNQMNLKTFDLNQYMLLDSAAVSALNIMPSSQDGANKSMCLFGLLNQCKTLQGQRLLSQWIKQPLLDKSKIEERLNIVEAIYESGDLLIELKERGLRKIPDLSRLSKRLQSRKATLQDCVRVYQAVKQLPTLMSVLGAYQGQHQCTLNEIFCKPLNDTISDFSKYLEMIEATIDLEQTENQEYLIRAEFDEALQECKKNMDKTSSQFPRILNNAARELNLEPGKTIKLETNSQLGYYFRITLKEEKVLRKNKRFSVLETRKDGIKFTNTPLSEANQSYKSQLGDYNELQSQLAKEVLKIAEGYAEPLQSLNDIIAQLDVLVSLATVTSQAPIPYVRPIIHEKGVGKIILKGARHPCLELQDNVAFISNDVYLERDIEEFMVITGPNMGGKSTYIRQVGLITLMAQIGCFVPCTSAEISVMGAIFARLGAGDSQQKGVSTFMSEMVETSAILRAASRDSLIIIDELGRGTSTFDGFGIAWAVSEYISTELRSFCLFATHFHELTALANHLPVVANYHVSAVASFNQMVMLFKLRPGVCDQSFGIHVAEMVKIPKHVIEIAKIKSKELENRWISLQSIQSENEEKKKEDESAVEGILQELREIDLERYSQKEVLDQVELIKRKFVNSKK